MATAQSVPWFAALWQPFRHWLLERIGRPCADPLCPFDGDADYNLVTKRQAREERL